MATVMEVMAKLTGDASGMVAAFKKAKDQSKQDTEKIKADWGKVNDSLNSLALPSAAIVGGAVLFGKKVGDMASVAEQNVGAVEAVFKQYAGTVKEQSKKAADAMGLSSSEYQGFATVVGSQLKNLGVPFSEVASGTDGLIQKGADLASMFGGTTSDAVAALSSLLRGESDPIERYGVSLKINDVNARMAAEGLDGLTGEAYKQAKIQTTLKMLNEQTADATGNFGRELETTAGKSQVASAKWKEAQVMLGEKLLPVMTELAGWLTKVAKFVSENSTAVMIFSGVVVGLAAGLLGVVGALKVIAAWTNIVTLATWALGVAQKALPIMWVVMAIGALVAGVIYAYKNIGWFKDGVNAAWANIKVAVGVVVDWFKAYVWPWLKQFGANLVTNAMAMWQGIKQVWAWIQSAVGAVVAWFNADVAPGMKAASSNVSSGMLTMKELVSGAWAAVKGFVLGVWNWMTGTLVPGIVAVGKAIAAPFMWLYNNIVKPYFGFITTVIGGFYSFFRGIGQMLVSIIVNIIAPAIRNWWTGTVKPVFEFVVAKIQWFWRLASSVFNILINFIRTTLAAAFTWFRDNVINPVWAAVSKIISDTWNNKIRPIFAALKFFVDNVLVVAFNFARDKIKTAWDTISGGIKAVYNGNIKPVLDGLASIIETKIPKAFEAGRKAIGIAWNKVKAIAKAPVEFVIDKVINEGLISAFNTVAGFLPGVDKLQPVAKPKGWRKGGYTGSGNPNDVAGVVHKNELVLPSHVTSRLSDAQRHALVTGQAISPTGAVPRLDTGVPGIIRYSGRNRIAVEDNSPGWQVAAAAAAISEMSALKLYMSRTGNPRIQTYMGVGAGTPPGVIAYAQGNNVRYNPAYNGYSPGMKRAVSIHELLHVLGHAHTGAASIMQPVLGPYMNPTGYDVREQQRLYGKGGTGNFSGGGGSFDTGPSWLDTVVNLGKHFADLVKKFEGGGLVGDLAYGIANKLKDSMVGWVKGKLFDTGGVINPGFNAVQNNSGKPEALLNNEQWSIAKKSMLGGSGVYVEVNFYGPVSGEDGARQVAAMVANEVVKVVNVERRGGVYVGGLG